MAYILTCENCTCKNIKFIEQNGELLTKGTGKTYSGTIALQVFDDRDDMRITLADAKNVYSGFAKRLLLPFDSNYLCHFDFNDAERKNKRKLLKIQIQQIGSTVCIMLICFDFSNYKGVCYLLPNYGELKKWAKKLNISTYEYLDQEGNLVSTKQVRDL